MFQIEVPNREITDLLPRQISDLVIRQVFQNEGYNFTDVEQLRYTPRIDDSPETREEFLVYTITQPVQAIIKGAWDRGTNIMSFQLVDLQLQVTGSEWPIVPSILSPTASLPSALPPQSLGSVFASDSTDSDTQETASSPGTMLLQSLRRASGLDQRPSPGGRENRSIIFDD